MATPTFKRPSSVLHVTSSFTAHKTRVPPSVNPGVDYGAPTGTYVVAPAAGKVFRARWSDIVGNYLIIHHTNGWGSDLLHNSKLLVAEGSNVTAGQRVAISGATGKVTGPHIHWSLRPNHSGILANYGNVDGEKYVVVLDPFVTWLGLTYVRKLEGALGLTVDGAFNNLTDVKKLQTKIGLTGTAVDGKFGENSAKALQKFVGVTQDGVVGTGTIAAWKKAIDAGKFGALAPAEITRKTGATLVNVRSLPTSKSTLLVQAKVNTYYVVTSFAHGEAINGNDIWFKLVAGWAWSGGFTSKSTAGLTETVLTPPTPTPVPPTGPTQAEVDALKAQLATSQAENSRLQTILAAIKKALL